MLKLLINNLPPYLHDRFPEKTWRSNYWRDLQYADLPVPWLTVIAGLPPFWRRHWCEINTPPQWVEHYWNADLHGIRWRLKTSEIYNPINSYQSRAHVLWQNGDGWSQNLRQWGLEEECQGTAYYGFKTSPNGEMASTVWGTLEQMSQIFKSDNTRIAKLGMVALSSATPNLETAKYYRKVNPPGPWTETQDRGINDIPSIHHIFQRNFYKAEFVQQVKAAQWLLVKNRCLYEPPTDVADVRPFQHLHAPTNVGLANKAHRAELRAADGELDIDNTPLVPATMPREDYYEIGDINGYVRGQRANREQKVRAMAKVARLDLGAPNKSTPESRFDLERKYQPKKA